MCHCLTPRSRAPLHTVILSVLHEALGAALPFACLLRLASRLLFDLSSVKDRRNDKEGHKNSGNARGNENQDRPDAAHFERIDGWQIAVEAIAFHRGFSLCC